MPLYLATTDTPGAAIFATVERLSDATFFNVSASAFQANPSTADRRVTMTEGTGINTGSFKGSVTGLGDAGWVLVRIHDDSDPNDKATRGGITYVEDGEEVGGPDLVAIRAKTDVLGVGRAYVVSPVAVNGDVTVYRGDSYTAARGRALEWTSTGGWPSLSEAVVTLEVDDGTMIVEGEVVSSTVVRVQPLGDDTDLLGEGEYTYRVVASFAGTGTGTGHSDRVTLASGKFTVLDREDG